MIDPQALETLHTLALGAVSVTVLKNLNALRIRRFTLMQWCLIVPILVLIAMSLFASGLHVVFFMTLMASLVIARPRSAVEALLVFLLAQGMTEIVADPQGHWLSSWRLNLSGTEVPATNEGRPFRPLSSVEALQYLHRGSRVLVETSLTVQSSPDVGSEVFNVVDLAKSPMEVLSLDFDGIQLKGKSVPSDGTQLPNISAGGLTIFGDGVQISQLEFHFSTGQSSSDGDCVESNSFVIFVGRDAVIRNSTIHVWCETTKRCYDVQRPVITALEGTHIHHLEVFLHEAAGAPGNAIRQTFHFPSGCQPSDSAEGVFVCFPATLLVPEETPMVEAKPSLSTAQRESLLHMMSNRPLSVRARGLLPKTGAAVAAHIARCASTTAPWVVHGFRVAWQAITTATYYISWGVRDVTCGCVKGADIRRFQQYCGVYESKVEGAAALEGVLAMNTSSYVARRNGVDLQIRSELEWTFFWISYGACELGLPYLCQAVSWCFAQELLIVKSIVTMQLAGLQAVLPLLASGVGCFVTLVPVEILQQLVTVTTNAAIDGYMWYVTWFVGVEVQVLVFAGQFVSFFFGILQQVLVFVLSFLLVGWSWYLETGAASHLIVVGLQSMLMIRIIQSEKQRRVQDEQASSWLLRHLGGAKAMFAVLATEHQGILQYLYHHLVATLLLIGVSFVPVTLLRTLIQHLLFPYKSHTAMMEFLHHPTKVSPTLLVMLVARALLTTVIQFTVTNLVTGLVYEVVKLVVGAACAGVALWFMTHRRSVVTTVQSPN